MRKSRYKEEQIIAALKEAEAGTPVNDLLRRLGVSRNTFYRWKAKYGGLEVSEARRLHALEDENRRLKKLVAELSLDVDALRAVVKKSGDAGSPPIRGPLCAG